MLTLARTRIETRVSSSLFNTLKCVWREYLLHKHRYCKLSRFSAKRQEKGSVDNETFSFKVSYETLQIISHLLIGMNQSRGLLSC